VSCVIDAECLPRSQSCPAEFFVERVIAEALKRERELQKQKKKRIANLQRRRRDAEEEAEEHALLESYIATAYAERCELAVTDVEPTLGKRRPGTRIAQLRREAEQSKKSLTIVHTSQTPAEYIRLITGSGIRGVAYDPAKNTTSLRQLLLHLNGYPQESNLRMHCSSNHRVVHEGITLREAGILPKMTFYLAARGKEKTIRIGRQ
jgi:hypothetical protein